jgi:hypothetical protein
VQYQVVTIKKPVDGKAPDVVIKRVDSGNEPIKEFKILPLTHEDVKKLQPSSTDTQPQPMGPAGFHPAGFHRPQ